MSTAVRLLDLSEEREQFQALRLEVRAGFAALGEALSETRADMVQRFDLVEQKFDTVDRRLGRVEELGRRLQSVEKRLDKCESEIQKINSAIVEILARLHRLEGGPDSNGRR